MIELVQSTGACFHMIYFLYMISMIELVPSTGACLYIIYLAVHDLYDRNCAIYRSLFVHDLFDGHDIYDCTCAIYRSLFVHDLSHELGCTCSAFCRCFRTGASQVLSVRQALLRACLHVAHDLQDQTQVH